MRRGWCTVSLNEALRGAAGYSAETGTQTMVQRYTYVIGPLLGAGILVLCVLFSAVVEAKTIDQMSNSELIELAKKLPPDQRDAILEELAKASQIAQDLVDRGRKQLNIQTEGTRKEQVQRTLARLNANEAAVLAEVVETVRQHIFVARLFPNAYETGALAMFNDRTLCDVKRKFANPILEAICETDRPPELANLPPLLDPIIIWHCNMPRTLAPEGIRKICDNSQMTGSTYTNPRSNPAYAVLETLFRNDNERIRRDALKRKEQKEARKEKREEKATCGRIYHRAYIGGLFDHSENQLDRLSGIQKNLVKRMVACKRAYGTTDSELYPVKRFGRRERDKERKEQHCSMYNSAFPKFRKLIQSWNYKTKETRGLEPVVQTLVANIRACNRTANSEAQLAPRWFKN